MYTTWYQSLIGRVLLASDGDGLIGVWFENQKYFLGKTDEPIVVNDKLEIFKSTKAWLDRYFTGEKPQISEIKLKPQGTAFQQEIWKLLCEIPYGEVTTYGSIAKKAAERLGRKSMSAQAVGGAVGRNPISVIIPCHRVIGADGGLTGYAGGIDKKIFLLKNEGVDCSY